MVDARARAEGLDMVNSSTERVDPGKVQQYVSGAAQILKCIWQCDASQGALLSSCALLSRVSSTRTSESLSRAGSQSTNESGKDEATADTTYLRDWSLATTVSLPHATSSRTLASSVLRALCLACSKFSPAGLAGLACKRVWTLRAVALWGLMTSSTSRRR